MISYVLRPVRQLAQALVAHDSPRQVAWGFVLGMLLGVVPKGNLTAMFLGILLLALQVNKSAGLCGAGLFACIASFWDSFAHRLGVLALTWEPLRGIHTTLYNSAISPYFGLNNSVVVGQLILGTLIAYPTYRIAYHFSVRIQSRVANWLLRYRAIRWLRGAELGSQWGLNG